MLVRIVLLPVALTLSKEKETALIIFNRPPSGEKKKSNFGETRKRRRHAEREDDGRVGLLKGPSFPALSFGARQYQNAEWMAPRWLPPQAIFFLPVAFSRARVLIFHTRVLACTVVSSGALKKHQ